MINNLKQYNIHANILIMWLSQKYSISIKIFECQFAGYRAIYHIIYNDIPHIDDLQAHIYIYIYANREGKIKDLDKNEIQLLVPISRLSAERCV